MTPHPLHEAALDLDRLLAPQTTDWRPSMAFSASLERALDTVDATLADEAERIPQDGARSEQSVLFSLDELAVNDHTAADAHEPSSSLFYLRPPTAGDALRLASSWLLVALAAVAVAALLLT